MLRRMVLLGGMLLVGVIVLSGVALAEDIRGTFGPDDLEGTNQMDRIYGLGAKDTLRGRAGNDDCYGGRGANDTILAADGQLDVVDCGLGTDTAYVDELDEVAENCEEVFLARPPETTV